MRVHKPVRKTAANGDGAAFIAKAIQYREADCYLWPYGKKDGYGSIQLDGHTQRAHRIVCEAVYGPPPFPKADAAHSCGVRACCNPSHLRWDTRKGNMADSLTHGTRLLGERVSGAKLTAADVTAIRSQPHRSQEDLAREYGVQQSNINSILTNRTWKHVPWTPIQPRASKTHCPQGHPYNETNTYLRRNGWRMCRHCMVARTKAWRARRRQP